MCPQNLEDIISSMRMVAEGVKTASSVDALSTKMGVEMPICQQVFEASRVSNVLSGLAWCLCHLPCVPLSSRQKQGV